MAIYASLVHFTNKEIKASLVPCKRRPFQSPGVPGFEIQYSDDLNSRNPITGLNCLEFKCSCLLYIELVK